MTDKKITSPIKAIRKHCLDCCTNSNQEVKRCDATTCALHPFRFGKNPYSKRSGRVMSPEQKEAARKRMAEYWAKKRAEQEESPFD